MIGVMSRTALGGMYLSAFVLCCLGGDVFGSGAAMSTLQKPHTKLTSKILLSDPTRLRLPHSHSLTKHVEEILEIRGIFKKIVKCQQKKPDEDMLIVDNRKKKSVNLDKGSKIHYIVQRKPAHIRKNKMIITNRKRKIQTRKKNLNIPSMKGNKKKLLERHFRNARRSKKPNNRLYSLKHRKPKVMTEQKKKETYGEIKRKRPRSKRIELFTGPRRNKDRVRKRKFVDRRANSSSAALERTGSSIPRSPIEDRHQEPNYSADGEVEYNEATTIKNELSEQHIDADTNTNRQYKENDQLFSPVVTTTFDGLKGSEFLTHATTTRAEILSQHQSSVMSKELHKSNSESESPFKATTVVSLILLTNSPEQIMSNKITLAINEIRGEDTILETTDQQIPPSWNHRALEPTEPQPVSTQTPSEPWIKTHQGLHSEEIGSNIVDDQIKIQLLNNSILQVESSGDSEGLVELVQNNRTLQVPETAHVKSTDTALYYPIAQKDSNAIGTNINGNEETQNSAFSSLEMAMNYGSEATYCKPGYKSYAGICKSMCVMGDFYCENGGQCVIVENLGAMCRCHQTNNLCYRGECCRLSLTPFQLICVIGSCCIFVSVFLGSISLLMRRMDIKAVSKSVRTRLWISTLMPNSRSSSFSHSMESELTAFSEYDSPDLSSFNCKKEVTYEGDALKCERTRL